MAPNGIDLEQFRSDFSAGLDEIISRRAKNSTLFTKIEYQQIIDEIETAKATTTKKTSSQYRKLNKYQVIEYKGGQKLATKPSNEQSPVKYYVHSEEIFDILWTLHEQKGHARRDVMIPELAIYENIPRTVLELFLNLCTSCLAKKKKKGIVTKPLLFNHFWMRCQVDLIDFQTTPDGEYKFIMNFQDHLTKFSILRPLKQKSAEAVARELRSIFALFGAPMILQSDNGREFRNKVIDQLKLKWPWLKMVHGKPRHSQSQGSVERSNQKVQDIIMTSVQDDPSFRWAENLDDIQFKQNRNLHSGIKQAPLQALFGIKPRVSASVLKIPNLIKFYFLHLSRLV